MAVTIVDKFFGINSSAPVSVYEPMPVHVKESTSSRLTSTGYRFALTIKKGATTIVRLLLPATGTSGDTAVFDIASVLRGRVKSGAQQFGNLISPVAFLYSSSDDDLPYQKFTIEVGYQVRDAAGAITSDYAEASTTVIAGAYVYRERDKNPAITDHGVFGDATPSSNSYKEYANKFRGPGSGSGSISSKALTARAQNDFGYDVNSIVFNDGMSEGIMPVCFFAQNAGQSSDKVRWAWQPSAGGAVQTHDVSLATYLTAGEQDDRYVFYINPSYVALLYGGDATLQAAITAGVSWVQARVLSATNSARSPRIFVDFRPHGTSDSKCLRNGRFMLQFINEFGVPETISLDVKREYRIDLTSRKYARRPLLNYDTLTSSNSVSYGNKHQSDIYDGEYAIRYTCETAEGISDNNRRLIESLMMTRRAWIVDAVSAQTLRIPVKVLTKSITPKFRTQDKSNYTIELELDRQKVYA